MRVPAKVLAGLSLALPLVLQDRPAVAVRFVPAIQGADPAAATPRYEPAALPDPFEPHAAIDPVDERTPLERVTLEEIEILGIATGTRRPMARVKAGDGYYNITQGTKIGPNRGRVAAIRDGKIIVRERYRDEGNISRTREVTLSLPE